MEKIYRLEHPKPQFERENWQNLNGIWDFEIDNVRSGDARGLQNVDAKLSQKINVPFAPESDLSGVGHKDFMLGVWYQKKITLTQEQCAGRIFLHFGAVDYESFIYINGVKAGYHKGGFVSFKVEITDFVQPGENTITVNAHDDVHDRRIPRGKQCVFYASKGCSYTRTTGIWQTVWLEFTPKNYIKNFQFDTNTEQAKVTVTVDLEGVEDLALTASYEGKFMGEAKLEKACGQVVVTMDLAEKHLWELGQGRLYDLELTFGEDKVKTYFGLRTIRFDGMKFLFNGRSVFQRLILDQGFYPDGVLTAPSDEALAADIDMSMAMGFNGARAHEKIFEERWLYHADKKGYLVWGEYPNWGLDYTYEDSIYSILPEWIEEINRDRNHPCIIGWCPFNETWDKNKRPQYDDVIRQIYRVTKAIDPSRPCIDTSGNFHVETDIYDVHDYNQDPVTFKEHYDLLMTDGIVYEVFDKPQLHKNRYEGRQHYPGKLPVFVSEYGGIRWAPQERLDENRCGSWGYGKDPVDYEDFKARFKGLTDALLDNDQMFGLCYTQLTDVEQEQNGLYTYQREAKFDPEWVKSVMGRKAAIED